MKPFARSSCFTTSGPLWSCCGSAVIVMNIALNPEATTDQSCDTYRKTTRQVEAATLSAARVVETSVAQSVEAYERSKNALEAAVGAMARSFDALGQGAAAINRKIIEIAQHNVSSGFDLAKGLATATTLAEVLELRCYSQREPAQAVGHTLSPLWCAAWGVRFHLALCFPLWPVWTGDISSGDVDRFGDVLDVMKTVRAAYGQYVALAVADSFESAKAAADAVVVTYAVEKPNVEQHLEADDDPATVMTSYGPEQRLQSERGDAVAAFASAPVKLDQTGGSCAGTPGQDRERPMSKEAQSAEPKAEPATQAGSRAKPLAFGSIGYNYNPQQ